MEVEGSLLLMGLCPVSAITQEPNENPITFLERLKEALKKLSHLNLLGDPPVQESQEVVTPCPALGFYLQEAVMPLLAWGSAP